MSKYECKEENTYSGHDPLIGHVKLIFLKMAQFKMVSHEFSVSLNGKLKSWCRSKYTKIPNVTRSENFKLFDNFRFNTSRKLVKFSIFVCGGKHRLGNILKTIYIFGVLCC